ncbi:hypothetical protein HWC64_gp101 [Salmonella phage OSY-STA]|uniref:Uncharacterized protein n=1 Tax=Salmonella phage OSY-STA TaxID=2596884 RepID=A0A5C2H7P5_9CAUD|nr:hypothetical protein HWC64_gp101 [Salmonella phage OSY-STA]QEP29339.1 hypothetical protein [Salmonella phage OSY-STA]
MDILLSYEHEDFSIKLVNTDTFGIYLKEEIRHVFFANQQDLRTIIELISKIPKEAILHHCYLADLIKQLGLVCVDVIPRSKK